MTKKAVLIIVGTVTVVILLLHSLSKPKAVQVNGYHATVTAIEHGNTLIFANGYRCQLLGVAADNAEARAWLANNNIVGQRVRLVADSGNEKTFPRKGKQVKAYALISCNGSMVCLNRLVINDCRSAYSRAYLCDSSFVTGPDPEPVTISDKALYMQQRTLLVKLDYNSTIGTAFFISKDGLALTNNHVLPSKNGACVYRYADQADDSGIYQENRRNIAEILWTNPSLDITLFQVELNDGETVPFFPLARKHEPKGRNCHLFGNPQGYMASYSGGHISAYQQDQEVPGRQLVQYELATNSGNSGGPVMNDNGEVIAVHVKGQKQQNNGQSAQGLNFGVDILQIRDILGWE